MRRGNRLRTQGISLAALTAISFHVGAADEFLTIDRISPEGVEVSTRDQIVIEFDQPVVPVGQMDRDASEIPIAIEPALNCQWRWISRSALACILEQKDWMAEATKYSVTIEPGIVSTDGLTTARVIRHQITTRRPRVSYGLVTHWDSPTEPTVAAWFNQPVTKSSLESGIVIVDKAGREFQVDPIIELTRYRRVYGVGEDGQWSRVEVTQELLDEPADLDRYTDIAALYWQFRPKSKLDADTDYTLAVLSGVQSIHGPVAAQPNSEAFAFSTFGDFRFAGVRCQSSGREPVFVEVGQSNEGNPQTLCDPLSSIRLEFTVPIACQEVADKVEVSPAINQGSAEHDPWIGSCYESEYRGWNHRRDRGYRVTVPTMLQANTEYSLESHGLSYLETLKRWIGMDAPDAIVDAFGRDIEEDIDFSFWTAHRNAKLRVTNDMTVLESGVKSDIPMYVTNLESVTLRYLAKTSDVESKYVSGTHTTETSEVEDLALSLPVGIREILEGRSGLVVGELRGDISDAAPQWDGDSVRRIFAQITPYSVHAKIGYFNSLAWVTDMQTGQPVEGVRIRFFEGQLAAPQPSGYAGEWHYTDSNGIAILEGVRDFGPQLEQDLASCDTSKYDDCEFFTLDVEGEAGVAQLPLHYDFGVGSDRWRYTWSFNKDVVASNRLQSRYREVWGTTPQGVYRKGQPIQYKIYVREHDNRSLSKDFHGPYTLSVRDPMGNEIFTKSDISTNEFGAFDGEFTVPESGVMGWYQVDLKDEEPPRQSNQWPRRWNAFRVLVSDFSPALIRVSNRINAEVIRRGDTVEIETEARLHSGAPYSAARTGLHVRLRAGVLRSDDPKFEKFEFSSYTSNSQRQLSNTWDDLSDQGLRNVEIVVDDEDIVYGRVIAESQVRDDRGRSTLSTASATYFGLDRFVGLAADKWIYDVGAPAQFRVLVIDDRKVPVEGVAVEVDVQRRETSVARVKTGGNAYVKRYSHQWLDTSDCDVTTTKDPVSCEFTPDLGGMYRAVATVEDTKGSSHVSEAHFWVQGTNRIVWAERPGHTLKMTREPGTIEVGGTARYLIENPFEQAEALVTIERYGVIDQWTTTLEGGTPVIEIPIVADYIPGVYVSVVAMAPRVQSATKEELELGELDLGKPTFRIGYDLIHIRDTHKSLNIEVSTDRDKYRPRDTVNVSLSAVPESGSIDGQPIEFAVAVLDESVLALIQEGTRYFDPYEGFYRLRERDVRNYSLLTRLMGIQGFSKKGASPGGGGEGALKLRDIERFVAYWNPSLRADSDGNAGFEFSLPDNLTGWRVLALAVTPSDRFGLGQGNFVTTQPTEVRASMPNQVAEGDRFDAVFTVMNRSSEERSLTVRIVADGDIVGDKTTHEESVVLQQYGRQSVKIPLEAQFNGEANSERAGEIRLEARAWDEADGDALASQVPVLLRRQYLTGASYGTSASESSVEEPIVVPENIHGDIGAISVSVSPSIVGNIDDAFRAMKIYPYGCWEQRLTMAVMASRYLKLRKYLSDDLNWDGAEELVAEALADADDFQADNGGFGYYSSQSQHVSNFLSAYTALAFNWLKSDGYSIPGAVEDRLHVYLRQTLRTAPRSPNSRRSSNTTRVLTLLALAQAGQVGKSEIYRHAQYIDRLDTFGLASLLSAASVADARKDVLDQSVTRIFGHANRTGGSLYFGDEFDRGMWRIHSSPTRSNCMILSAFVQTLEADNGLVKESDIESLARSILNSRKGARAWSTTQNNVFCTNAIWDAARVLESAPVDVSVLATLAFDNPGQPLSMGSVTLTDPRSQAVKWSTPIVDEYLGDKATVTLSRDGSGRIYYTTRLTYAPILENRDRMSAGLDVRREYSVQRGENWVMLDDGAEVARGDTIRVDLFVNAPSYRHFVVVDDAVPGALEPINRDLGDSLGSTTPRTLDPKSYVHSQERWNRYGWKSWGGFYHTETGHQAVRFYSEDLDRGNYHLTWYGQAVATGTFSVSPAHAEEMYAPDVFGKSRPFRIQVSED